MSNNLATLPNRIRKSLSLDNLERISIVSILLFMAGLALLLNLLPVVDYVDGVKGKLTSASPPLKLLADGQYRIAKVHVQAERYVRRGEILIEFDGNQLRSELEQTDTELGKLHQDLAFRREEAMLVAQKIALNDRIIAEKEGLQRINQRKNALAIQFDAEKKVSTEQIKTLANKLLNQVLPKMDDPSFSTMEKLKILSNAHGNLRQITELSNQIQNNSYLPEETGRKAEIEVATLRKENIDLKLSHRNAERSLQELASDQAKLDIRRAKLREDLDRLIVRAPSNGYLVNVSPNIRHSNLVKAGEEMFAIQDEGAPLEAELTLTDEQFKEVRLRQKVNLELYAWNHYKHGVVSGEITSISRDKIQPNATDTPQPVFVAIARLDRNPALDLKRGFDLKAKIMLGEISLLDYLLKKLNLGQ